MKCVNEKTLSRIKELKDEKKDIEWVMVCSDNQPSKFPNLTKTIEDLEIRCSEIDNELNLLGKEYLGDKWIAAFDDLNKGILNHSQNEDACYATMWPIEKSIFGTTITNNKLRNGLIKRLREYDPTTIPF